MRHHTYDGLPSSTNNSLVSSSGGGAGGDGGKMSQFVLSSHQIDEIMAILDEVSEIVDSGSDGELYYY